jgi:predicted permease
MREIFGALRRFRKSPGFAVTVVLTIALGIGANTAIFTLVHAVLLRSLPVQNPKMLYRLGDETFGGQATGFPDPGESGDFSTFSYDLYQHLRQTVPALKQMAAMESGGERMNIRRGQEPAKAQPTKYVSGNYFETFGIGAFAGRVLSSSDDMAAAAPVAVISYAAWQADYAGDPKIIGQTLTFQNQPVTVVGIAPAGFYGDRLAAQPPDFWLPLSVEPVLNGSLSILKSQNTSWLYLIARLPEGTNTAALAPQISSVVQQWLRTIPAYQENGGAALIPRQHVVITPGGAGILGLQSQESKGLYLLMAICLLVLLVACANVANLLLARGAGQRADISLRMALGAARIRLLREMMVESLLLSCIGGLVGLVLAYSGTRMILALAFPDSPQLPINPNPSPLILGFTFLLSLITGAVFGIVPAWITSHADPAEALRGINRSTRDRASQPQRWLVVFQAALSLLLLVCAGMFTRSLSNLQHQNLGFQTDRRYVVHFDPQGARYTAANVPGLYQSLLDRLGSAPGVDAVGLALYSPLEHDSWASDIYIEGRPETASGGHNAVRWDRISPQYFQAVGQPMAGGRAFTDDDTAASQGVAVVSRAFVEKYFPNQNPIGRHFGTGSQQQAGEYEIVGIVTDAKYDNPTEPVSPMFFLPVKQAFKKKADAGEAMEDHSIFVNAIVLKLRSSSLNADSLVRRVFAEIDPNLPVSDLQTLSFQVSGNFNEDRLLSRLAALFGALALVLAAVGLYGITSYQVSRRTNEIGVRMALGATRGDVLRTVLKGAMKQVGLGLVIGVPIAILGAHSIASQLYGVSSYDPLSLLLAIATLLASAAIAGIIPARRAASIEPVAALRTE